MKRAVHEIYNGYPDHLLIFELFDYKRSGNHKLLGSFDFSMESIINSTRTYALRKENKAEPGVIEILDFKITPVYSFLEYIEVGANYIKVLQLISVLFITIN